MNKTKSAILQALTQGPRTDLSKDFSRASGVALLLCGPPDNLDLLFIKRATNPNDNWSGQIAFPGGKVEPGDDSVFAACLRETREEVGHDLRKDSILGALDDLQGRKRGHLLAFYIRPFIFYDEHKPNLRLSLNEVETTYWVPLDYLADEKNQTTYHFQHEEMDLKLPGIQFPDGNILWGLTYMMIQNLFMKLNKG